MHRLAAFAEDRDVDPAEVLSEASAPDDVRNVHDTPVLQSGQAVLDSRRLCDALDTGCEEVLRLHADQRGAALEDMRSHLAADRRLHRQNVRGDEPEDRQDKAPERMLDSEWDLALVSPREPGSVGLRHFHTDVRAGIPCADEENAAWTQLGRIPVFAGVHLDDAGVELGCKLGH